ncbi:M64 family metallopeptidase [Streptomyces atratus]|uniref:M64 family metallopeptidase n=1 Tax=Streptomyces atratus TaxID=1893 RepID=UPI0033CC7CB2
MTTEPYRSYRNLFNVWTVDAVSNDSGIGGYPGADVVKDTAPFSYFWCGDTGHRQAAAGNPAPAVRR